MKTDLYTKAKRIKGHLRWKKRKKKRICLEIPSGCVCVQTINMVRELFFVRGLVIRGQKMYPDWLNCLVKYFKC